jgi:hypothetical protein
MWIGNSLATKVGQFKQFRNTKLNLFGYLLLEMLTILREVALSVDKPMSPTITQMLDAYRAVKSVLAD